VPARRGRSGGYGLDIELPHFLHYLLSERGTPRERCLLGLLVAAAITTLSLLAAQPSAAQAPRNGTGFGISDSDDYVEQAMGYGFAALRPSTFRFIVPYNAVQDPALMERTAERIGLARSAGVREVVVTFGARGGDSAETGFYRPSADEWISLVRQFMDRFDPEVDVWGPANEPNAGVGWLGGAHSDGPRKLAGYYLALEAELRIRGGHDKLLSPEFHDQYDGDLPDHRETRLLHGQDDPRSNLAHYLDHYVAAGGGFGDYIGWHPYSGVRRSSVASTEDLISATPSGPPIWITEVGAVVSAPRLGIQIDLHAQNAQVRFIVDRLSELPRVARVSYWHMINLTPGWDSALLESDGKPRPAWYTWCAAAHGGAGCDYGSPVAPPPTEEGGHELIRGLNGGPWALS